MSRAMVVGVPVTAMKALRAVVEDASAELDHYIGRVDSGKEALEDDEKERLKEKREEMDMALRAIATLANQFNL